MAAVDRATLIPGASKFPLLSLDGGAVFDLDYYSIEQDIRWGIEDRMPMRFYERIRNLAAAEIVERTQGWRTEQP